MGKNCIVSLALVFSFCGLVACNANTNTNVNGINSSNREAGNQTTSTQKVQSPTSSLANSSHPSSIDSSVSENALMIILDASGSMSEPFGNQSKMEAAKNAVQAIIKQSPSNQDLSVTVYGEGGKNSCHELRTLESSGNGKRDEILNQISNIQAEGDTPIAASIQKVAEIIKDRKEETTIILVSDGEETCGGDPCQVIEELKAKEYRFIFHGIGVDTSKEADKQLRCLARVGGGNYVKVQPDDPEAITRELKKFALSGQFRIKKPISTEVNGWQLIRDEKDSQQPILLVRQQSESQLWNTYPLDPGLYKVCLFLETQQDSVCIGQVNIKENEVVEFDTKR